MLQGILIVVAFLVVAALMMTKKIDIVNIS